MPLNATFVADFTSFLSATDKAIAASTQLEQAADKVGPAYDRALKESTTANEQAAASQEKLLTAAREYGRQIGDGIKDLAAKTIEFASVYVDAYAEAERATVRLSQAVKNAGEGQATVQLYEDLAASLSKVSTFSSSAIVNVETLLTSVGNIKPDNMEATLRATLDLAAGMAGQGMSLEQAAILVARAAASDGDSIGKLKLILGDTVPKGADFNAIMQAINEKFGGQAQADLGTYAGQMEHLKNQIGDLNEKIGAVLVPALSKMLDFFQKLPDGVQQFLLAIGTVGTALAPVLASLASLVTLLGGPSGVGAAILSVLEALGTLVAALIGWPGLIVAALVAAGVLIYKYWDDIVAGNKWAVQTIKDLLKDLGGALSAVPDLFRRMYEGIKVWLLDRFADLVAYVEGLLRDLVAAFQLAYNAIVGHSIVPDLINGIAKEFGKLDRVMVDPTLDAVAAVSDSLGTLSAPELGTSTLTAGALAGAGASSGGTTINVTMSGMMGTDDPQTRAALRDVISSALMSGMRGSRLMGTT